MSPISLARFLNVMVTFVLAYPASALIQHGLDPGLWPSPVIQPGVWFGALASFDLKPAFGAYWEIMIARSDGFANGGWTFATLAAFMPLITMIILLLLPKLPEPKRAASSIFGSARFATKKERAAMSDGLELGIDPDTGRAVRVAVQGTLLTIAPPRTGKTSGVLIPNLAYCEPQAWAGPAVVIDPKGEVYRATAARRSALGRRVVCLDPLGLVGGTDCWNPLQTRDPDDILYLQQSASALLPETTSSDEASTYFRSRAVDLITGAMLVALREGKRSVVEVQHLMADETRFKRALQQVIAASADPAALAALEILDADPKTKDPVKSTAAQAFQWLADKRLRNLVHDSTFDLAELSSNEIDLFVAVPPEHKRILAPLLRWLLSDLFVAVRRNRPQERILVFIDEAAALGRFDEILTAAGELPGYGASVWTLWQDRSQIVALYGEAGASTLINTAEIVTLSDLSAVDPAESERWSKALGHYTALVEAYSGPSAGQGQVTTTSSPQAAPLMSQDNLVTLPPNEMLVFPNSGAYGRHPLKLRKIVAHRDPRFGKLIQTVRPVGAAR